MLADYIRSGDFYGTLSLHATRHFFLYVGFTFFRLLNTNVKFFKTSARDRHEENKNHIGSNRINEGLN